MAAVDLLAGAALLAGAVFLAGAAVLLAGADFLADPDFLAPDLLAAADVAAVEARRSGSRDAATDSSTRPTVVAAVLKLSAACRRAIASPSRSFIRSPYQPAPANGIVGTAAIAANSCSYDTLLSVSAGTAKTISVRFSEADYAKLETQATALGLKPAVLARVIVRTTLNAPPGSRTRTSRRRFSAALKKVNDLVATGGGDPVDAVELIHRGREERGGHLEEVLSLPPTRR